MKIWVTKYALTKGIICFDAEETKTPDMVVVRGRGTGSFNQYFHGKGKEWHRSEAEAKAHAEEMRRAKIASLKSQIAKLEKKVF